MHPGSNGTRALALHDLERQLSAICRHAVRATLLASALSPAVACGNAAPQRREAAPPPAPASPPATPPAQAAAGSEVQAEAAPPPAPLPSIFDAESATPVAPPAASAEFVAFPCGTPPLERTDQERIWADQPLYERFARMQARLEYDLRARSLTPSAEVEYLALNRATHSEMVRVEGQPISMMNDRLAEHGTPCATAPDKSACEAELKRQADAVWANERCDQQECRPFYYVYAQTTRGAEVKTYVGKAGLSQLFGPIDTPTEAWFVLAAEHIFEGFACGDVQHAAYRTVPGGHELRGAKFTSSCRPLTQKELTYRVDQAGKTRLVKQRVLSNEPEGCVVSGRRPPGLTPSVRQPDNLAGYLSRAAHLEAASVHAFETLEHELAALGAPEALLEAVRAARADECDHATRMAQHLAELGAAPPALEIAQRPLRSRLELALDNAREGCVRELFGALVAQFQASRAQRAGLRASLVRVADDELRHAALSWALADWLEESLPEAQRQQVADARVRALDEVRSELAEPSLDLMFAAGLPSVAEALQLTHAIDGWLQRPTRAA